MLADYKTTGKNSGAITYSVYYYAKAQEILKVEPNSFIPEPAVDSEVINLKIRKENIVNVEDEIAIIEDINNSEE